jgi:hypothetical protein
MGTLQLNLFLFIFYYPFIILDAIGLYLDNLSLSNSCRHLLLRKLTNNTVCPFEEQ